jgi:hypothetical protein
MTDETMVRTSDARVYSVVFFCPGCRRRIIYRRMTPFCWHLNSFCSKEHGHLRMRRSKNQSIDRAEKDHAK